MIKHHIDLNGNYLGLFEETEAPNNAQVVSVGPVHSNQVWDGASWSTQPNPEGFITALLTDPTLPMTEVSAFIYVIDRTILDKTKRQLFWARLKSQAPPWLTPENIGTIEGYSTTYGVDLT